MKFSLIIADEWTAHDPFGKVKDSDAAADIRRGDQLVAARGAYASFRVVVIGQGTYALKVDFDAGIEVDIYRAWYHAVTVGEPPFKYYADALIPVAAGETHQTPNPENRIAGQRAQEFWVDVYVPRDAQAGALCGEVELSAGSQKLETVVTLTVRDASLPDKPSIVIDNNSYSAKWLATQYPRSVVANPQTAGDWRGYIRMLHNYYRLSHEHRMLFHNLGYRQSGQFEPIYGPEISGRGRDLKLTNWGLYDAHYGPLLDGEAFTRASPGMPAPRQKALPIWGIYTPLNPTWPADYLWWGEPGYEEEFTRGVAQLDAHLRERGWVNSNIEFFINHKKRHRWFEWDGDEGKFEKDDAYHLEMIRLWKQGIGDSPVPWVYRVDASWQMKWQFDRLAGASNFWVCNGFCSWYPREIARIIRRGDIVMAYGGYPAITAASSAVLHDLYRTWVRGMRGFIEWLATDPGEDPWFASKGSATGTFYPGERFGIDGPLPSIRLKIMRNGIQDIDLLHEAAGDAEALMAARAKLQRKVGVRVWKKPPQLASKLPPEDWDSVKLSAEHEPMAAPDERLGPGWWSAVRGEIRTETTTPKD